MTETTRWVTARPAQLGRSRAGARRIRLASSPLLAALRRVGTRHLYGDTADEAELGGAISTAGDAILEEIDGNTVNQPLMRKVLARLLDDAWVGRLARMLQETDGAQQQPALAYALLCARVGNEMTRGFAAGRRWDVSLQLHMGLGEHYEDSVRVGLLLREMVPNALVKVPFAPDRPHCLLVARDLERAGVPVNLTSTFSARQVAVAALVSGVARTNVFLGRIEQGLEATSLGERVAAQAQRTLRGLRSADGVDTQLIVASMRDWRTFARLAGCDVFTAPCALLQDFLGQEEVSPADLRNRLESPFESRVSERVQARLGRERIARLHDVEPELLEFLRDLRDRPGFSELTDGDRLYEAFDAAGFADLFHAPTAAERAEARAGKLPDLDGGLVDSVPLDTHYSLLANADFESNQEAIDAQIEVRLRGKPRGVARPSEVWSPELGRRLHAKAVELVRLSLEMTAEAGSGHPTSAASLAHLVTALMYHHMRWDPAEPDHPAADRLVLSEGHACPIVYAAAADLGVAIGHERRRPMTREDALRLRTVGSPVEGHPNPEAGFPFFPAATGSLGQGLSVAAGIALAARLDGLSKRVYCLIGDGESREGQVWEALDFLVDQGLTAVCPIFNANGFGQTGAVSPQQSAEVLADKLRAFGLEPLVLDGHDPQAILPALRRHEAASEGGGRPVALVARTVKGWGSPSLASKQSGMHGQPALGAELERALAELDRQRVHDGESGDVATLAVRPIPAESPAESPAGRADAAEPWSDRAPQSLEAALEEEGEADVLSPGGELATRKAYGLALRALGRSRPEVVVLDGDVSNSTYAQTFAQDEACQARFFECRIAEQNMVSVAAGLSSSGKTAFVSSFGKFLARAYDQIEMVLIGGLPLRLVGSHAGVSLAADGPSQMALPDAAWFGAWSRARRDGRPLLHVLTPSDARCAYALTIEMARHEGAVYLRTLRPDVPLLYAAGTSFSIGGHHVVREGADLLIASWGYAVHEVLRAAEELSAQGVQAAVVDLYSLPFDADAVAELARRHHGRVLSVEDNYGGALGAALAESLAGRLPGLELRRMFVRDVPRSGRTPQAVLADLELSAGHVARAARELLGLAEV